jgi:hypothetical protein
VAALIRPESGSRRAWDLDDTGPSGLAALERWLQAMGYDVRRTTATPLPLNAEAHLFFIFAGTRYYTAEESSRIRQWVLRGGTAILLGFSLNDSALRDMMDIWPDTRGATGWQHQQVQPLLPDLPAVWDDPYGGRGLDLRIGSALPVLVNEEGVPTLAIHGYGDGLFWFAGSGHTFTNAGLRDANQAALLPALLRTVPPGGVIFIDAYHSDYYPAEAAEGLEEARSSSPRTLQEWLYRTPTGQATLTALILIFAYLLLYGRRLGPPLPAVTGQRRREAAEFVAAMAAIQRRAHLRAAVARHHKQRLKRHLGHLLQISPALPDAEFLQRLTTANEQPEPQRLHDAARLLQQLENAPSEEQLVALVTQVDSLTGLKHPT